MYPVIRLRLAQTKMQAVHHLERVRLQVDQDEEETVCIRSQHPFRPAANAPLPLLAFGCQVGWIELGLGGLIGWQQLFEHHDGQSCRSQKTGGLLFELRVG